MITSYLAIFFVTLAFIDGLLVGGLIVFRACHKKQLGILRRLKNINEVAENMLANRYSDTLTPLSFILCESDLNISDTKKRRTK